MARNRPAANGRSGVTTHDPERAWRGYTLYWSRDTGGANLIDMDGKIVHTWSYPARPELKWHHADMLDNGNLLALPTTGGYRADKNMDRLIVEIDWNNNVVWSDPAHAHHDARRLPNGDTLLVSHGRGVYPWISDELRIYDFLQEVTPEGGIAWEWHAALHYEELASLTQVVRTTGQGDWPHINTAEQLPDTPLGQKDARFRAGNILVSPRHLHCVFIIDRDTDEIVWAWGVGELLGQHQPTMLENGNILIFDNGRGNGGHERGWSRVVEIEPLSGEIVWEYKTDPLEDFFSPVGSGQQRLPNGNTLICAMNWAETGRVFEVTPEGEIVWEFWNPDAQSLYRSKRYAPELVEGLIEKLG